MRVSYGGHIVTGDTAAAFGAVLKYYRDGVAFYRRANRVAADPRVRLVFERLARHRAEAGKAAEAALREAGGTASVGAGPTAYPFEAVSKVECYVCGHVAEDVPDQCPKCGAARYAFEKEFSKGWAWGSAVTSGQAGIAAIDAAIPHAKGAARSALEALRDGERALLREAEGEVASAKP